jgi:hypothetical protein
MAVALATALPYVALAQSVQAEVKKALEAGGFKDVKVDPRTFAVQAKDAAGSPVTILINPDTFVSSTELENPKAPTPSVPNSETGENAKPDRSLHDEETTGSLGSSNEDDKPSLTPGQKQVIWDSLSSVKAMRTRGPNGYAPRVGANVPHSVSVRPLPDDITSDVPALTGYHFAVAGTEIVIMSPTTKKVVAIFGEQ